MRQEQRIICYDSDLNIEAYSFKGIVQKFPNHFHEHYVIGFIEKGNRFLSCKNKEYTIEAGDIIIFNPKDNHTCEQIDNIKLDYKCINVSSETMAKSIYEITGKKYEPQFTQNVIFHSELISSLKELHKMIMAQSSDFKKEEIFFFLIGQLVEDCTDSDAENIPSELNSEIKTVCEFLEKNYTKNITLDELSKLTGLSKYYLLRSFTKQKGISPYSYLETVRINNAKKLLEKGIKPADTALMTGFSDQSHFSNFFKKFIGITPKQYMKIFSEQNISQNLK